MRIAKRKELELPPLLHGKTCKEIGVDGQVGAPDAASAFCLFKMSFYLEFNFLFFFKYEIVRDGGQRRNNCHTQTERVETLIKEAK